MFLRGFGTKKQDRGRRNSFGQFVAMSVGEDVAKRRRAHSLALYIGLVFLVGLSLFGCDKATQKSLADSKPKSSVNPDRSSSNTSTSPEKAQTLDSNPASNSIPSNQVEVLLYFADEQAQSLRGEKRRVSMTEGLARETINELIKGPTKSGYYATIPDGTRLLNISVSDNVATVDFSKEFIDNHTGGSAGERMTVYSVVNTLTEFSTITKVLFLVEGQEVDTLAGHMDIGQPVGRDEVML